MRHVLICMLAILSEAIGLAAPPPAPAPAKEPEGFVLPTPAERAAAVGDLKGISNTFRPYFLPNDKTEPLPAPQPGDWLADQPEIHQSFDLFVKQKPNKPDKQRTTIYLLPLNEFDDYMPQLEELRDFMQRYFAMPAKVLPVGTLPLTRITERVNPNTRKKQWLSTDVLRELKPLLPKDAYCMLAVTTTDLYPDPKWNFVFGQATFSDRVGVYSFARFDPAFWRRDRTPEERPRMLRRTCQLIAHETGHMFGIRHCVYYRCVMNGSNSQDESDATPLTPCPVCMRKLHWSIGFNPVQREAELAEIYKRMGISGESLTDSQP